MRILCSIATTAWAGAKGRSISSHVSAGGKVEGYPEAAPSVPAGFLFNGALSTYEKLGFVRDRKIGKHRWVVTKVVGANVVGGLAAPNGRSAHWACARPHPSWSACCV